MSGGSNIQTLISLSCSLYLCQPCPSLCARLPRPSRLMAGSAPVPITQNPRFRSSFFHLTKKKKHQKNTPSSLSPSPSHSLSKIALISVLVVPVPPMSTVFADAGESATAPSTASSRRSV